MDKIKTNTSNETLSTVPPSEPPTEGGEKNEAKIEPKNEEKTVKEDENLEEIQSDKKIAKKEEKDEDVGKKIKEMFTKGENLVEKKEKINRPRQIYLNTFQLGPRRHFSHSQVNKIIEETLGEFLGGVKYNSKKCGDLCGKIGQSIRDKVIHLKFDRYKILCLVTIGPKSRQGVEMGFGCLWDSSTDSHGQGVFSSYYLFAIASVYGVYLE